MWHRRAGKDLLLWNKTIVAASQRRGLYAYLFPEKRMGKDIIWDGMDSDGRPFLDYIPPALLQSTNSTEMKATLRNGSIIKIFGVDHLEQVGFNPVWCVFSEFALQDPRGWNLIRPILAANHGQAHFNFTPRGDNHAIDLWKRAEANENWFTQRLTVDDTGVISEVDIQEDRDSGMPEDMILQEYWCNIHDSAPGAYYGDEIKAMESDGRIGEFPYDDRLPVHTAWDIGVNDSTCIWFMQKSRGGQPVFIDYHEDKDKGCAEYVEVLYKKRVDIGYKYGTHLGPHDLNQRDFSTGTTTTEVAANLGIKFTVLERGKLDEGIRVTRALIRRSSFDEKKCADGINALKNYQSKWDRKTRAHSKTPLHNWASHGADALRQAGMGEGFIKNRVQADEDDSLQKYRGHGGFAPSSTSWMGI